MLKLFRLSPAEVSDPAKLAEFETTLNDIEEEAVRLDLLTSVNCAPCPDGGVFASVQYATVSSVTGRVTPADRREIEGRRKQREGASAGPSILRPGR